MTKETKKTKLLLALTPVSCPLCKTRCDFVSADGARLIVKHQNDSDCENDEKCWSVKQQSIEAVEV